MPNYTNENGKISKTIILKNGDAIEEELANFSAKIVERINYYSNSNSPETIYKIDYQCDDESVPTRIEVPERDFDNMAWVVKLTHRIGSISGRANASKEVYHAITKSSRDSKVISIVPHIGWVNTGSALVYLTPSGPISPTLSEQERSGYKKALEKCVAEGKYKYIDAKQGEIRVRLPNDLRRVQFPYASKISSTQRSAIASALRDLEMLGEAGILCLAVVATTILGHGDFCAYIHGDTNSFKSTTWSVAPSFFGRGFNERNPMATFNSSANALEHLIGCLPDSCPFIDDFVRDRPNDLDHALNMVIQGTGNNSARQRMNGSGGLQNTNQLRTIPVITGEHRPERPSLMARVVYFFMEKGSVSSQSLAKVTEARDQGHYNNFTSLYLHWLVQRKPKIDVAWPRLQRTARRILMADGTNKEAEQFSRLISNYTSLVIGMHFLRRFLVQAGLRTKHEALLSEKRALKCLREVLHLQVLKMTESTQDVVILNMLRSGLLSSDAYLTTREGEMPKGRIRRNLGWRQDAEGNDKNGNEMIGYVNVEKGFIYLLPERAAQFLNKKGWRPAMTGASLGQILRKHLVTENKRESLKVRITVSGKSAQVYCLPLNLILEQDERDKSGEQSDSVSDDSEYDEDAEEILCYLKPYLEQDGESEQTLQEGWRQGWIYDRHTGQNTTTMQIAKFLKDGERIHPRLLPRLKGKARELAKLQPILANAQTLVDIDIPDFQTRTESYAWESDEELAQMEAHRLKLYKEKLRNEARCWSFDFPYRYDNGVVGLYQQDFSYREDSGSEFVKGEDVFLNVIVALSSNNNSNKKPFCVDLCRSHDFGGHGDCEDRGYIYHYLTPILEEDDFISEIKRKDNPRSYKKLLALGQAYAARIYNESWRGSIQSRLIHSSALSPVQGVSGFQVDIFHRLANCELKPRVAKKYGIYEVRISVGPMAPASGGTAGRIWRFVDTPLVPDPMGVTDEQK